MKKLRITLFIFSILFSINLFSQVAINTDESNPDASAMLDVQSTNLGFLMPRMTAAQKFLITSPALGLTVFDIDSNNFYFHNGLHWQMFGEGGSSHWLLNGNNIYAGILGNVGIGTSTPDYKLTVDNGNALIKGGDGWSSYGDMAQLFLGHQEHSITSIYSQGIRIRTNPGSNHDIRFGGSNGEDFMTIKMYSGNVGIGTTNPETDLDIRGSEPDGGVLIQAGNSDLTHRITLFSGRQNDPNPFIQWKDGDPLRFSTDQNGWSEKMRISSEGMVGIGTDDPKAWLHIEAIAEQFRGQFSLTDPVDDDVAITFYAGTTYKSYLGYTDGKAVWATSDGSDLVLGNINSGNVGIGTDTPTELLDVNGTAKCNQLNVEGTAICEILQITGGADIAEPFDITDPALIQPGMVMVIDPDHPGKLKISENEYDRCVAGIVSGAGEINPGMIMGQNESIANGDYPVALSGRVYCMAESSNGNIAPGDLITTSNLPGYAMKVTDINMAQGAIIGKAMTPLKSEKGLILVLVTLQ